MSTQKKSGYVQNDGTVILTEDGAYVASVKAITFQEAQRILERWEAGNYQLLTE